MTGPGITLEKIWIYPIKSLGGVAVARASVTEAGSLGLDREWVVVDPAGNKLWQGDLPRMALTRCALDDEAILVDAPAMPQLRVPRAHDGAPCTITMYKQRFDGIDAGAAAAQWLSAAFGTDVRLVRIGHAAHGWQGLNPIHVLSTASLAALNAALQARGDAPVEIERFRPNLLLDGGTGLPPFFEERYDTLRLGTAELRFREPCVRCQLPNISRLDASRGHQPLKLIGALSRERPIAPAAFGIYARLTGTTTLEQGASGEASEPRVVAA